VRKIVEYDAFPGHTMERPIGTMEELFTEFTRSEVAKKRDPHLMLEALRRLRQMRLLVTWVIELENERDRFQLELTRQGPTPIELANQTPEGTSIVLAEMNRISEESWLHCETFYYVANRFFGILDGLPPLHSCRPPAIRDIRHHLIEHASTTKGITMQAFSHGDLRSGPMIKPVLSLNGKTTPIRDRGLFVNLDEMASVVCERLRGVLGKQTEAK
jgi:hypothetical protein